MVGHVKEEIRVAVIHFSVFLYEEICICSEIIEPFKTMQPASKTIDVSTEALSV